MGKYQLDEIRTRTSDPLSRETLEKVEQVKELAQPQRTIFKQEQEK